jgi:hypothetical protein
MNNVYMVLVEGRSLAREYHYKNNTGPARRRLMEMIAGIVEVDELEELDSTIGGMGRLDVALFFSSRNRAIEIAVILNRVLPKGSEEWYQETEAHHNAYVYGPVDTDEPEIDGQEKLAIAWYGTAM